MSHQNWSHNASRCLAFTGFLASIVCYIQILPANGESGHLQGQLPSLAATSELGSTLREKGFIVLVLNSSNKSPLLNVDASYVDSNSNGLIDSGDKGFFNPASTVKVMVAGLILETINKNGWRRDATYQAANSNKKYSFDRDIEEMLVISDNDATNRLVQFLGFKNISTQSKQLGLSGFEVNRLMMSKGPAVASPAYTVINSGVSYTIPPKDAPPGSETIRCRETPTIKGNCATATDLLSSLALVLDNNQGGSLDLAKEDRQWVSGVMGSTPRQRGFDEPDEYCRFIQPLTTDSTVGITSLRSKCGVAPFSPTFVDLSRITTKDNRSYDMLIAKKYTSAVSEDVVVKDFSNAARYILASLKRETD